jgi:3-oxoacyl-[acyl-carrier protein] reductase
MSDPTSAPFDFSNKVVLVTGSSRGIGAGMVEAFGKRGARCVVNYVADSDGRNKADAERIAAGLAGAVVLECDVADEQRVAACSNKFAAPSADWIFSSTTPASCATARSKT